MAEDALKSFRFTENQDVLNDEFVIKSTELLFSETAPKTVEVADVRRGAEVEIADEFQFVESFDLSF